MGNLVRKDSRGELEIPTEMKKKGTIHVKCAIMRRERCLHQNRGDKGVKQKSSEDEARRWTVDKLSADSP